MSTRGQKKAPNAAAGGPAAKAAPPPAQAPFDAGAAPAPPAPEPPPTPAAAPAATAANGAAPDPSAADGAGPKQRHQMTQILDIDISNARCHSHMKASLISPETEAALSEKRAALKAAKAEAAGDPGAETSGAVAAIKKEIDEINESVVRIGGDTPIAMATICDHVAKSMIKYAMDQTLAAERKMVEVSALHTDRENLSKLDVWVLIRNLPSIVSYDADNEKVLREERAAQNRAAKEAREAAKKARDTGEDPAAPGHHARGPERAPENDDDDENAGVSTTFNTYVDNATKTVKEEDAYKTMRVSHRLREVISRVIAELVANLSRVAKVAVLDLLQVRTLAAGHLKSMVKALYVHQLGTEEDPGMRRLLAYVDDKLALYEAHISAEKTRKLEQMPAEEKNKILADRAAAEEARKKARVAAAKAKAIAAASLAKELADELARSAKNKKPAAE